MRALLTLIILLFAVAGGRPAAAQEDASGASYITPFPVGDVYKVQVVGDDFADGLLFGLVAAFGSESRLQIQRRVFQINGFMRPGLDQKLLALDQALTQDPQHIVIVMISAWDRVSIRDANGRRVPIGSEEWRGVYSARADRMMKLLKKRDVAVYWVGLPNMRRPEANEDAQMMNELLRERAYLNGFKFVDTYSGFADESGGYSAYGPDLTGTMRLLRDSDGTYFTAAGNRKLAHFVERLVRRDMTQATAARLVPLAGDETEQTKVRPQQQAPASGGAEAGAGPSPGGSDAAGSAGGAVAAGTGEQKAENGKISLRTVNQVGREEVVTLDILRPAIPASVVALVTRKESADRPSQMGVTLVDSVRGGLTLMSSVSPANDPTSPGVRFRLAPTQTPYFRVLIKGERLPSRPGRVDDFSWPRASASGFGGETGRLSPPALETGATDPAPAAKSR